MRLRTLSAILICMYVLAAAGIGDASGQPGLSCPYRSGIHIAHACPVNQNPAPIPPRMGGTRMVAAGCESGLIYALASLYSYDDAGCHPANSTVGIGSYSLKFVGDASDYFPPNYRRAVSRGSNFHATLYCDMATNTLILAFRGSSQLTPLVNRNQLDDWFYTNFFHHVGERPLQYEFSEDAADANPAD